MNDDTMPDVIYVEPGGDRSLCWALEPDEDFGEKYHHDRVVQRLQEQETELTTLRDKVRWHTVQVLTEDGPEWIDEAVEPEKDEWVIVEIRSAASLEYKCRKHDPSSWPSFGLRWMRLPIPESEQDD